MTGADRIEAEVSVLLTSAARVVVQGRAPQNMTSVMHRGEVVAMLLWSFPGEDGKDRVGRCLGEVAAALGADAVAVVTDVTMLMIESDVDATIESEGEILDPAARNALLAFAVARGRVLSTWHWAYRIGDDGRGVMADVVDVRPDPPDGPVLAGLLDGMARNRRAAPNLELALTRLADAADGFAALSANPRLRRWLERRLA